MKKSEEESMNDYDFYDMKSVCGVDLLYISVDEGQKSRIQ